MRLSRLLEGEDSEFTASKGRLDRIKKQFCIGQITISEALSANKEAVRLFKDYLAKLIQKEEFLGSVCTTAMRSV